VKRRIAAKKGGIPTTEGDFAAEKRDFVTGERSTASREADFRAEKRRFRRRERGLSQGCPERVNEFETPATGIY